MTTDELMFRQILADNGCHVTKARQVTFQLLQNTAPLSISELLRKAHGKVDRVSVYRNLELFEKLGIAHRVYIGWKHKWELTDTFTHHHHHLSCISCGTVIDIADEKHIDEFIRSIAAQAEFTPVRHQFEIEGYCNTCRRNDQLSH